MVILECTIEAFGKLKNKTISLRPGLNVITGGNESGKTTIADFLKSMLFGLREDEPDYAHYKPYEFTGVFGGQIKVIENTSVFLITRDFLSGRLSVYKPAEEKTVADPEAWLQAALSGMTKAEYEKSGYLAQGAFMADAERYRNTVEKDEIRRREAAIREDFAKGREELLAVRATFEAREDAEAEARLLLKEQECASLSEENENARTECYRKKTSYAEDRQEFDNEAERVEQANRENGEIFKEKMLESKKALAALKAVNEKALNRSNVPGILLLVAGNLAGIATYFYYASYGISTDRNLITVIAGAALAFLLLAGGIVYSVLLFTGRAKAAKAMSTHEALAEKTAKAERMYQRWLNKDEEVMEKVKNREAREEALKRSADAIDELSLKITEGEARLDTLLNERKVLEQAVEEQREIREEEKAIDIAIASFEKLGVLNGETDNEALGREATEILREMENERDMVISIESDVVYVVDGGRRILFSNLSTSTMQEVLFAIRLAVMNRVDERKALLLILDESFANLDQERLRKAVALIKSTARQTVLFSCQPREKQTVKE